MTFASPFILTALLAAAVPAPDAATECDRLASNPEDPDRIVPGVPRSEVDLPAAIAACETELARQPGNSRIRYQLARVLFYAGQNERAVKEMRAAADAGNRQAQFVYGLLISNRRERAPQDLCLVEQYWLKSARAGRQAARVSYVRHVLKGRFDGCRVEATREEMSRLLASAAKDASDYYERLLIEDLTERLDESLRKGDPS
jgi:TPR repeat protein